MSDYTRVLDRLDDPDVVSIRANGLYSPDYLQGRGDNISIIKDRARRELAIKLVNQLIENDLIEFSEIMQPTPMGNTISFEANLKVKSPYHKLRFIY
jgi:hypothetical protein